MANHKSSEKRARQTVVRRARNKSYLSSVRSAVKKFKTGLEELKAGKLDQTQIGELMVGAQSALQKAAQKGLIHKNNASRKVSRLALSLVRASSKK